MHLHSVIVSYNRAELTVQAIDSYLETVSVPYSLFVVDNCSDTEELRLLHDAFRDRFAPHASFHQLNRNFYPGYATNRGWEQMPNETTILHRGDNDFIYLDGWCEEVISRFGRERVGQVGLRTKEEERGTRTNVGGNNAIRRDLWEKGLRYDERPWGDEYPKGWTEDTLLSPAVMEMGYVWARVRKPCIVPISREDPDDDYYQRTWELRGITPPA